MASGGNNEYSVFPMEYLNVTQGYGSGTHRGTYAIDIAGKDKGIDNLFAPFTGVVKKIWPNGNTVWLESLGDVETPSGYVGSLLLMVTHDNYVSDLRVGQIINQGVNFYQEGTAGQATGNHAHLEIAKGVFTKTGWYQNAYGYWTLYNSVPPQELLYLSGTHIINGGGYNWKTKEQGEDIMKPTEDQVRDVFSRYMGPDAKPNAEQLKYYPSLDIRELYKDVIGNTTPTKEEVEAAFKEFAPDVNDPNAVSYYTNYPKWLLYKNLAGSLNDKLKDAQSNGDTEASKKLKLAKDSLKGLTDALK